ncbi:MAG: hypothetical protein R2716_12995 [Microthrixaceae bacterium]
MGDHPVVGPDRLALDVPPRLRTSTVSAAKNPCSPRASRSWVTWTMLGV